jgi:multiple sugar transport system substrate-binding protein
MKKSLSVFLVMTLAVAILSGVALGKTKIGYQISGSAERVQVMTQWGKDFEKRNPNIETEPVIIDGESKMQVMLATGTAPDLLISDWNALSSWAGHGNAVELTPFITRDRFDLRQFYTAVIDGYRWNDGLYALPYKADVHVMPYNVDLFNNAGVHYPSDDVNWDQLVAMGKKLTRDTDGDNVNDQYGFSIYGWYFDTYIGFIWMNDGEVYVKEPNGRFRCTYDAPNTVEAVQFLADLIHVHRITPERSYRPRYDELFQLGRSAMYFTGEWRLHAFLPDKAPNLAWDLAMIPRQKKRSIELGGVGYFMNSASKNQAEAWELLKFIATDTGVQTSVLETKIGLSALRKMPPLEFPVKNLRALTESLNYVRKQDMSSDWLDIDANMVNPTIGKILDNAVPVRAGLQELTRQANAKLGW